ncbi:MAG: hypothetical protein RLZZ237_4157 [Pseudomonadota bacterium]|jgi:hypothetical protein
MSALQQTSPYENIVIGNFLYGLGFNVARLSGSSVPPACINLLQQTPLDKKLSDVLVNLGGAVRLLEFKRTSNKSDKEKNKADMLRLVLSDQPHLIPVSKAVHWHILSGLSGIAQDVDVTLSQYIDAAAEAKVMTLAEFTSITAHKLICEPEKEPLQSQVGAYLKCIVDMAGASGSSNGGIVVHVSSDGEIRYVAVHDLLDLALEHSLLVERAQEHTNSIRVQRTLELSRQYELKHELNKSYGMEH